jgi:probable rRNA maturation factor
MRREALQLQWFRMPSTKTPAPTLELDITAATGKRFVPFVRRNLQAAHAILKPPLSELSLALVGDARMAQLHEQFMGLPGPTDVLTFPLEESGRGRVTSGEVVVCVPEALRRAKAEGQKPERELLLYALHGLLHLSGYDDRTAADYRRMHRTEDKILTQLGIGPVFDGSRGARVAPATGGPTAKRRAKPAKGARR